jgi:MFS superfamily sulfate permease-like transporter
MAVRMTPTERRLFKEAIIREYKLKHQTPQKKNTLYNTIVRRMKKSAPLNIIVGLIACIILFGWKGWDALGQSILSAVIWITLVGTIISVFLKAD